MSRRKQKSNGRWLWALGALFGAAVAYVLFYRVHRPSAIPVPGEGPRVVAPSGAPKEEIRDGERQKLERVLHEHAHGP